ncbi:phage tail tape measure protein [Isoptericola jiangsuensis]|uniref:phage tail tape measure protein n=1 Tax=Isoptericola jiangsuensis TaxID=548579 RepID=UPI003AAD53D4
MTNRTVVVDLIVTTGRWTSGLQKASNSMLDATKKNEAALSHLTTQIGLLGTGLTAFAALAVKKFADFDAAMSTVSSATNASSADMEVLRTAALEAGASTVYSATEAAGAITELGKAGLTTAEITGGALAGALDLAASEGMSVANAAEIMASAMGQFNLEGGDATHVADLLAAGAGKAQGSADDLGQALNQAGGIAHSFGIDIVDATATLALFAENGMIGSDAGTSLKTMLIALANPAGKTAEEMEKLGINAYDASGNFIGMEALAGQLQDRLSGLDQATRNAALAQIFGNDAYRAANYLYEAGADGLTEWIAKVDDQGYAAEAAGKRLDNLKGDLEALGGAFETLLIGMGEGADGPLRGLVQSVTDVINALNGLPDGAQQALMAIIGGGGLVALGLAGMGKLVIGINETRDAMKALNLSAKTAGIAAGGVGAALSVAAAGLTLWAQEAAEAQAQTDFLASSLDQFGNTTDETLTSLTDILSEDQNNIVEKMFGRDPESAIDMAKRYGLTIQDMVGYIQGVPEDVDRVTEAVERNIEATSIYDNQREYARAGGREFLNMLDDTAGSLSDAEKQVLQKAEANKELGVTEGAAADTIADTTDVVEYQTSAVQEAIDAWMELAGVNMGAHAAMADYEQSVDDARKTIREANNDTEQYSKTLKKNQDSLDLNTQAGRDASAALRDVAGAALDQAEAMWESGDSVEDVEGKMQRARKQFVNMAMDAGLTKEAAHELADEYGLIPENVTTLLTAQDDVTPTVDNIQGELADLHDKTVTITTRRVEEIIRRGANTTPNSGGTTRPGFAFGGPVAGPHTDAINTINPGERFQP